MGKKETEEKTNKKKVILAVIALIVVIAIILILARACGKKEYKITFDSNGGSEVNSVTVKEGEKIPRPTDPTKEGFVFGGWYYNNELYDFNKEVKGDMTLKAEWLELGTLEVEGIELDVNELTLAVEGEGRLIPTILPEGAKPVKLIWTTSDESIVTVDENGNIKGLKEGEAEITVTTEDGKYSAKCKVKVSKEAVEVTGVSISGANTVEVGSTIRLTATVKPDNATDKSVTWKSSNTSIATVDRNGNVKGIKEGTVTITVTTVDGGHTETHTVTVKAKAESTPSTPTTPNTPSNPSTPNTPTTPENPSQPETPTNVPVTGVTVSGTTSLKVGGTGTVTATVQPSNATNKNVTWSSSNPNVVSVDQNGKITGVGEGNATITATTADGGYTGTIDVTVSSVYVITLTPHVTDTLTNTVAYYTYSVTRDGQSFTNYLGFIYGPETIQPDGGHIAVDTVRNNRISTTKIILNDGFATMKDATVIIK